jgi:hypothetical protein
MLIIARGRRGLQEDRAQASRANTRAEFGRDTRAEFGRDPDARSMPE